MKLWNCHYHLETRLKPNFKWKPRIRARDRDMQIWVGRKSGVKGRFCSVTVKPGTVCVTLFPGSAACCETRWPRRYSVDGFTRWFTPNTVEYVGYCAVLHHAPVTRMRYVRRVRMSKDWCHGSANRCSWPGSHYSWYLRIWTTLASQAGKEKFVFRLGATCRELTSIQGLTLRRRDRLRKWNSSLREKHNALGPWKHCYSNAEALRS